MSQQSKRQAALSQISWKCGSCGLDVPYGTHCNNASIINGQITENSHVSFIKINGFLYMPKTATALQVQQADSLQG